MQLLFSVQTEHIYYADSLMPDSEIIADEMTQAIFNRCGVLTDMQQGVFSCYIDDRRKVNEILDYLNNILGDEPLRFFLTYNNYDFTIITDVPVGWAGQLNLSSKNTRNKSTATGDVLRLLPEYAGHSVYKNSVIGVITIYPRDLLLSDAASVRYMIEFDARKTSWVYYIVNNNGVKLHHPVISNKNDVILAGPVETTIFDGTKALSFSSGIVEFMLQQNPTEKFNLVDRVSQSGDDSDYVENVLIRGLPTPKNDQLKISYLNGEQHIYSEMYIYL